jgi:hypothetical protein
VAWVAWAAEWATSATIFKRGAFASRNKMKLFGKLCSVLFLVNSRVFMGTNREIFTEQCLAWHAEYMRQG